MRDAERRYNGTRFTARNLLVNVPLNCSRRRPFKLLSQREKPVQALVGRLMLKGTCSPSRNTPKQRVDIPNTPDLQSRFLTPRVAPQMQVILQRVTKAQPQQQ